VETGSATDLVLPMASELPGATTVLSEAVLLSAMPSLTPPVAATSAVWVTVEPPPAPMTPVTLTLLVPLRAMAPSEQLSTLPPIEQPAGVAEGAKPGGRL